MSNIIQALTPGCLTKCWPNLSTDLSSSLKGIQCSKDYEELEWHNLSNSVFFINIESPVRLVHETRRHIRTQQGDRYSVSILADLAERQQLKTWLLRTKQPHLCILFKQNLPSRLKYLHKKGNHVSFKGFCQHRRPRNPRQSNAQDKLQTVLPWFCQSWVSNLYLKLSIPSEPYHYSSYTKFSFIHSHRSNLIKSKNPTLGELPSQQ